MDYVRLGNTGLKVSRITLGCMSYGDPKRFAPWVLDEEQSLPFFKLAIEQGVNFFDTANVYSRGASEMVTGKALREYAKRHEVVVATKVRGQMGDGPNDQGLSRQHIMQQIDLSLKRLNMDYVDLYQIHRFDYGVPIEETMEALHDIVKAGKARYIGASSMYAWQFMKMQGVAERNGWTKFVSMQPQYNLVYREEEREMLPLCLSEGVGVIPWSPLARGFLAGGRGKPGEGNTERSRSDQRIGALYGEPDYAIVDAVSALAKEKGVTNMQVAMAWVLKNPAITSPIVGATKLNHLDEAIGALKVELTKEDIERLEKPYRPKRVLDHA